MLKEGVPNSQGKFHRKKNSMFNTTVAGLGNFGAKDKAVAAKMRSFAS